MELNVNGVDITATEQSFRACIYTDYANGHADSLDIVFNDEFDEWKKWSLKKGDTIRVVDDVDTGKMYVSRISISNGSYGIHAVSSPVSALNVKSSLRESISLHEIIKEVGDEIGLDVFMYDIKNYKYKIVERVKVNSINYLNNILTRESYLLKIFDGKLIIYNEKKIETSDISVDIEERDLISEPSFSTSDSTLISEIENRYNSINTLVSAQVCGRKLITSIPSSNIIESIRFSNSIMRNENKYEYNGVICVEDILTAGTMINLSGSFYNWAGRNFVYKVKHDLIRNERKVFIRKPIKGEY